jgi:hypothetical protein
MKGRDIARMENFKRAVSDLAAAAKVLDAFAEEKVLTTEERSDKIKGLIVKTEKDWIIINNPFKTKYIKVMAEDEIIFEGDEIRIKSFNMKNWKG